MLEVRGWKLEAGSWKLEVGIMYVARVFRPADICRREVLFPIIMKAGNSGNEEFYP